MILCKKLLWLCNKHELQILSDANSAKVRKLEEPKYEVTLYHISNSTSAGGHLLLRQRNIFVFGLIKSTEKGCKRL